jgi:hypothetical protein
MNQVVHLRLIKGERKLFDEKGYLTNENQTAKFDQDTIKAFLENLTSHGFGMIEVLSVSKLQNKKWVEDKEATEEMKGLIQDAMKPLVKKNEPVDELTLELKKEREVNANMRKELDEMKQMLMDLKDTRVVPPATDLQNQEEQGNVVELADMTHEQLKAYVKERENDARYKDIDLRLGRETLLDEIIKAEAEI